MCSYNEQDKEFHSTHQDLIHSVVVCTREKGRERRREKGRGREEGRKGGRKERKGGGKEREEGRREREGGREGGRGMINHIHIHSEREEMGGYCPVTEQV